MALALFIPISLGAPAWLSLLLPLGVFWWVTRSRDRLNAVIRAFMLLSLTLAIAEPLLNKPRRSGSVVVVVDRSASMPADTDASVNEWLQLLEDERPADAQLAVIGFGQESVIERHPGAAAGSADNVRFNTGKEASNLSSALRQGLSLIAPGQAGRLLVVSDGQITGAVPTLEAAQAASRSIAIDHRYLGRGQQGDLAIAQLEAPGSVDTNAAFMITAWVQVPEQVSNSQTPVRYILVRNQTVIAQGENPLPTGLNRLVFRDRLPAAGTADYQLHVLPASADDEKQTQDPVPENNTARRLVGVRGPKPLLIATQSPGQNFAQLLSAGGVNNQAMAPQDIDWSLTGLSNYAGVVLENVPAASIGQEGLANLAGFVQTAGGGLWMTGGRTSFGPGGYFGSPIDPLLPVSMELRQEHRKLRVAMVVALDRSGSMAMQVGGKEKIQLATMGAAKAFETLGAEDEFGMLAVDSAPHTVMRLATKTKHLPNASRIKSVSAGGGGIFVYEALKAAATMLQQANAGTRHVILFSDAQDSEQPGEYKKLLQAFQQAGITVSVIGLGTPSDIDAPLLKDIAKRGGGRCYFTEDARDLPLLFVQDTFMVARNSFVTEPTPLTTTAALRPLAGRMLSEPPAAGGYSLTYPKPAADIAGITEDEYAAPWIATWQAGLGRVGITAPEADGKYTGDLAKWDDLGELYASLGRWTGAQRQELRGGALALQRVDEGVLTVELFLDPNQPDQAPAETPMLRILRGTPGNDAANGPETINIPMRYAAPDRLVGELRLSGTQTALATVDAGPLGSVTLPPARLLYSPEYRPQTRIDAHRYGRPLLAKLSRQTGGRARIRLEGIWEDLPDMPVQISIAHWFYLAACVFLLMEVLERRTGQISGIKQITNVLTAAAAQRTATQETKARKPKQAKRSRSTPRKTTESQQTSKDTLPPSSNVQPEREGLSATERALQQATQRKNKR